MRDAEVEVLKEQGVQELVMEICVNCERSWENVIKNSMSHQALGITTIIPFTATSTKYKAEWAVRIRG